MRRKGGRLPGCERHKLRGHEDDDSNMERDLTTHLCMCIVWSNDLYENVMYDDVMRDV